MYNQITIPTMGSLILQIVTVGMFKEFLVIFPHGGSVMEIRYFADLATTT